MVELDNGFKKFFVHGKVSLHNIKNKSLSIISIGRSEISWSGIYMSIDSHNYKKIKLKVKEEYQKKGYDVLNINITLQNE